jgi:hypothetical protein
MRKLLFSVPGLIALIVLGLVFAAFAPQLASRAGTPEEAADRAVTMRRAGYVLVAAGAVLLLLRTLGVTGPSFG